MYQDSTKISTYGPLADLYKLLKVGGSDFHGTGAADEREPGKIPFQPAAFEKLLLAAKPIWEEALRSQVRAFVESRIGCLDFVEKGGQKPCVTLPETNGREASSEEGFETGEKNDQSASAALFTVQNPGGPKHMIWSFSHDGRSRTLLTPLLLTRSDREVVEVEAKRLECCVQQSERTGYKYLAISPG